MAGVRDGNFSSFHVAGKIKKLNNFFRVWLKVKVDLRYACCCEFNWNVSTNKKKVKKATTRTARVAALNKNVKFIKYKKREEKWTANVCNKIFFRTFWGQGLKNNIKHTHKTIVIERESRHHHQIHLKCFSRTYTLVWFAYYPWDIMRLLIIFLYYCNNYYCCCWENKNSR